MILVEALKSKLKNKTKKQEFKQLEKIVLGLAQPILNINKKLYK